MSLKLFLRQYEELNFCKIYLLKTFKNVFNRNKMYLIDKKLQFYLFN